MVARKYLTCLPSCKTPPIERTELREEMQPSCLPHLETRGTLFLLRAATSHLDLFGSQPTWLPSEPPHLVSKSIFLQLPPPSSVFKDVLGSGQSFLALEATT